MKHQWFLITCFTRIWWPGTRRMLIWLINGTRTTHVVQNRYAFYLSLGLYSHFEIYELNLEIHYQNWTLWMFQIYWETISTIFKKKEKDLVKICTAQESYIEVLRTDEENLCSIICNITLKKTIHSYPWQS